MGLASLACNLVKEGHEVELFDCMFLQKPLKDLKDKICRFAPDILGLSIRNLDNQNAQSPHSFLPYYQELVQSVRSIDPELPIVLGGPGFSIFPDALMKVLGTEYGIIGEGELALPKLIRQIEGQCAKDGIQTGMNTPALTPAHRITSIPAQTYLPMRTYHDSQGSNGAAGAIPIELSRGCARSCIYCTTPRIQGRSCRCRHPKVVVDEIDNLHKRRRLKRFYLVGPAFNEPQDAAYSLCRELSLRRLDISFTALFYPCKTEDLLLDMALNCGLSMANVGIESMCNPILKKLKRDYKSSDCKRLMKQLKSRGVKTQCFLLLGGPGESRDTVKRSIEEALKLEPDILNLQGGIRIYPGTTLQERAIEEGKIDEMHNLLKPQFYIADPCQEWLGEYIEDLARENDSITS